MSGYEKCWLSCFPSKGEKQYIRVTKRDRFGKCEGIDMWVTEEEIKIAIEKLKELINTEE
jgi:hypothetical protein|nr:MAG TPA: hypothetical protein [Caudoviricetes sp.]